MMIYFIDLFVRLDSYDLDIDNSALYFLFDRDRDSNRPTPIKKNIDKYYNSRDNNSYRNGLFLLSFPSIQAFYLNCKNDTNEFYNGNAIKNYCKNLDMTLSNEELINGTKTFINIIKGITGNFNIDLLDNFKNTNKKIFEFNETYFFENKAYKTLSLLFVSLLDLNLITIND